MLRRKPSNASEKDPVQKRKVSDWRGKHQVLTSSQNLFLPNRLLVGAQQQHLTNGMRLWRAPGPELLTFHASPLYLLFLEDLGGGA